MNICANHCSYLINFNYVIGLKENIDVVSRHLHQYALRSEVFKCRQVLMEKKPFLSYESNKTIDEQETERCFDKSRDILIDSHLCFEASQNSMLHSVLRSFKIRDRGGQKLNEQ